MDFSSPHSAPNLGSVIPHRNPCTSLSYHADGKHLFIANEKDSKVTLVDAIQSGKSIGEYKCDREGVSCLSATHNDYCVLAAGSKQTTVQYWSLYDNKILRKFKGHTSTIYDINVCPTEDMFLTSSNDQTVRLWNMEQAGCVAKMDLPKDSVGVSSQPRAAFDSTGMVFTILAEMARGEGHYIHLYDARNYQGGAFSELKLTSNAINEALVTHRVPPPPPTAPGSPPLTINKISFNESGNRILVHAAEGYALVLDGYEGTIQRIFRSSRGNAVVSCFTPDETSLLMGSDTDGLVDVYDLQSGMVVKTLEGGHGLPGSNAGPITAVACNPKFAQIATGGAVNTRYVQLYCLLW